MAELKVVIIDPEQQKVLNTKEDLITGLETCLSDFFYMMPCSEEMNNLFKEGIEVKIQFKSTDIKF